MSFKNGYLAIALMSGLSVVACSNTAAGIKDDAEANAEKAKVAADKAEDKVDPAIDKAQAAGHEAAVETKEAAREAGAATKEVAREAGSAAAAAIETIDVKSALMADRTVDASHINVDTLHETKTVVLKGSVKSATQRDEAARIAAAEAPGYRIDNQLRVVANP